MRLEKKDWISPRTNYQEFTPQEFIAGCYHVRCKTDAENGYYNYLYLDSNHNQRLDTEDERVYIGTFKGCNIVHTGVQSDTDLVLNGFVSTGAYTNMVYVWKQHTTQYGDWHVCYDPTSAEYIAERPNAS